MNMALPFACLGGDGGTMGRFSDSLCLTNQNIEKNRSPCYHVKADGNQIDSHLITESIKSGGLISPVSPLQLRITQFIIKEEDE